MPRHTVSEGDCIISIAADNGFLWETLWNHPDNAALKEKRKDPNILYPGDVVVIPDKTQRIEPAATEQRHKYKKKANIAQVKLRLLDFKRQPRADLQYTATVDGQVFRGTTDSDGYITLRVPPNAHQLKLKITDGARTEEYNLPLGSVDPVEEISGVQHRLTNLGYSCASEQGNLGELTKAAIEAFQKEKGMTVTGEIDDATRQALKEAHGS